MEIASVSGRSYYCFHASASVQASAKPEPQKEPNFSGKGTSFSVRTYMKTSINAVRLVTAVWADCFKLISMRFLWEISETMAWKWGNLNSKRVSPKSSWIFLWCSHQPWRRILVVALSQNFVFRMLDLAHDEWNDQRNIAMYHLFWMAFAIADLIHDRADFERQ